MSNKQQRILYKKLNNNLINQEMHFILAKIAQRMIKVQGDANKTKSMLLSLLQKRVRLRNRVG